MRQTTTSSIYMRVSASAVVIYWARYHAVTCLGDSASRTQKTTHVAQRFGHACYANVAARQEAMLCDTVTLSMYTTLQYPSRCLVCVFGCQATASVERENGLPNCCQRTPVPSDAGRRFLIFAVAHADDRLAAEWARRAGGSRRCQRACCPGRCARHPAAPARCLGIDELRQEAVAMADCRVPLGPG